MRGLQERAISLKGVGTPARGSSDIALARAGLLWLPLLASPLLLLSSGGVGPRLKLIGVRAAVDVTEGLNALLKVKAGEVLDAEVARVLLFPVAFSMPHQKIVSGVLIKELSNSTCRLKLLTGG